jgi:hypothetical protein
MYAARLGTQSKVKAKTLPIVQNALGSAGEPVSPTAREPMERSSGHDFSSVRVHSDIMRTWQAGDRVPLAVGAVLRTPGTAVTVSPRNDLLITGVPPLTEPLSVRVHTDSLAADAAMSVDAAAFNVGTHIVFGPNEYQPSTERGRALIRHELRHIAQRSGDDSIDTGETVDRPALERQADLDVAHPTSTARGLLRHPAVKALKWSAKWLSKRTAKRVSHHIAAHTRRIATKPIHSVMLNPRGFKYELKRAISEATAMVERQADRVSDVIEEGAIRVSKQHTSTPGKPWWVVEKTFMRAIGTQGETVLRIVVNHAGKIVTAFPTHTLKSLGVGVGVVGAFTTRTAEAAQTLEESRRKQESLYSALEAAENDDSWWEWVPIIGDIWGGSLNVGESQTLAIYRQQKADEKLVRSVVTSTIDDIQEELQRSLGPAEEAEVEEYVRMVLMSGMDVAAEDVAVEP